MTQRSARRLRVAAVTTMILGAAATAFAAAGSLDPSFGTGGVVRIVPNVFGSASAVLSQSDGKVVVAGFEEGAAGSAHPWRIRRLEAGGSADTSFGASGQVTLFGTNPGANDQPWALAQDGSGRILVVGASKKYVTISGKTVNATVATIVRLNGDGSLDSGFGTSGVVTLIVPGMYQAISLGRAVALQPDGKIIVAGWGELITKKAPNGYQSARFAARLTSTGALDTSFGAGGISIHDVTSKNDIVFPNACALQSNGKILLGGSAGGTQSWAITRLLANGSVDTSFGTLSTPYSFYRLAVDASDRIVVSGALQGDGIVARYTSNGATDTSFGGTGTVTLHDPASTTSGGSVLAGLADGRIAVSFQRASKAFVARLLSNGAMDTGFGVGGIGDPVAIDVSVTPTDMAPALDGGILLCGSAFHTQTGGNVKDWFVARYLGN